MAPHTKKLQPQQIRTKQPYSFFSQFLSVQFLKSLVFDPKQLPLVACVLLVGEIFLNVLIIERVRYTEIDWKAYMQEVEGVLNGTLDYSLLKGDTGPLVYPAGFVYLYMILYYATQQGENIKCAQYIFGLLYIILLMLVFRIYVKSKKVPPYVIILSICTSYRIHSIFVLRMFNDSIAIIFLYASINLFMDGYWTMGSLAYSAAVSVKMNILLFAPALLIVYLTSLGVKGTFKQLSACAALQVILDMSDAWFLPNCCRGCPGLPFLLTHPLSYIQGAFNLGRVFLYEWTVNWRFLSEDVFTDKTFHLALLGLHVLLLLVYLPNWVTFLRSYACLRHVEHDLYKKRSKKKSEYQVDMSTSCCLLILPLFTANLIGITCARSLHYQFYVWYYHSLPYLAWSVPFGTPWRLAILGILELCWNTFPSTSLSSAGVHLCHIILLLGLYFNRYQAQDKPKDLTKGD